MSLYYLHDIFRFEKKKCMIYFVPGKFLHFLRIASLHLICLCSSLFSIHDQNLLALLLCILLIYFVSGSFLHFLRIASLHLICFSQLLHCTYNLECSSLFPIYDQILGGINNIVLL